MRVILAAECAQAKTQGGRVRFMGVMGAWGGEGHCSLSALTFSSPLIP